MTNAEKFKEVFGYNISTRYIPNMEQNWNLRALFISKANYIDCAEEWLQAEYKENSDDSN